MTKGAVTANVPFTKAGMNKITQMASSAFARSIDPVYMMSGWQRDLCGIHEQGLIGSRRCAGYWSNRSTRWSINSQLTEIV